MGKQVISFSSIEATTGVQRMLATVLIPAYNVCESLERCLLSLNHQALTEDQSFDVVVVDNGSTDDTANMVRRVSLRYQLDYHCLPRTSLSSRCTARNFGIAKAQGDIIIMLDGDQIVPPEFVQEHLDFHAASHDLVVVGPRDYLSQGRYDNGRLAKWFDVRAIPPVGRRDSRGQLFTALSENLNNLATCWHYFFTCNLSVRRSHLLAVGGFDENFKGWGLEDSELGYRLRRRGLAFAYNSKAVSYHPFRGLSAESKNERYADWQINLRYFIQKYDDDAEVAAQYILDRSFNPRTADLDYLDTCLRFEFAARAFQGRLPSSSVAEFVEIDEMNGASVLASLPERANSSDLVILDYTNDRRVPVAVQVLNPVHELDYVRCTPAEAADRIGASHVLPARMHEVH